MKTIFYFLTVSLACGFLFTSCSDDEWGSGDPAMEHVYYFGFQNWGSTSGTYNNNKVVYSLTKGNSLQIPVEFHSERTRSYDVVVYYYVSAQDTELKRGIDYQITDENGTEIHPDSNGAFAMTFPKAVKEVRGIYVKSLSTGSKGSFYVLTFAPNAGGISHPDNIVNSKTNEYEVRAFTRNYKVKVDVK